MKQVQKVMMMFLILLILMISFANANQNVIEVCDEDGELCKVYDSDLNPVEGVPYLKYEKNIHDYPVPKLEFFTHGEDSFCMNQDKMYFTYYASVNGVGADPEFTWEEGQFWDKCNEYYQDAGSDMKCYTSSMYGCSISLRMSQSGNVRTKISDMSLCTSGGYAYTFTSKKYSYIFKNARFGYGDTKIEVWGKCYDSDGYKYYDKLVDKYNVKVINCDISCPPTYYSCIDDLSYKHTYKAVSGVCKETTVRDTNTARNLVCAKEYCEDNNGYWYDNDCHDNQQCTPFWDCGAWGACNPDTETQLRYCNDGCGATKTETQDCTPSPSCGNGDCTGNEDCHNCPLDCGECPPECGDGICDAGETKENCLADCDEPIKCGNGKCDIGETQENCPEDCQDELFCGDGTCDKLTESCVNCPADCDVCELCITNSECIPANPDECISYLCKEGQCREVPILSEECIGQSIWEQLWDKYKYYIIGGGSLLFLGTAFLVMLVIAIVLYIIFTRKPNGNIVRNDV